MEPSHTQNYYNALLKTEQLHQKVTFLHSWMLVELGDRRNKAEKKNKEKV